MTLVATPDAKPDARVFAAGSALWSDISGLGVWDFVPVKLTSGGTVVVNRGFVPDGQQASPARVGHKRRSAGYAHWLSCGFRKSPARSRRMKISPSRLWIHPGIIWRCPGRYNKARSCAVLMSISKPGAAVGVPKPGPLGVHLRDPAYAIRRHYGPGSPLLWPAASGFWFAGQRRA